MFNKSYAIILILFLFLGCAKEEDKAEESTASKMSTPSFSDGNYKLTATTLLVYYSNGTLYGNYTFQLNHDTTVTPGYFGYTAVWKGSGVYRITSIGKVTLTTTGLEDSTVDCSTNRIDDLTLDTEGNILSETTIQTGCGGSSSTLTTVSEKFTPIS